LAEFVPALKQQVAQGRRVRIWSAGCSTGEEPYSIAMTLLEHWPDAVRADIRILATDIDPKVVEQARRGVFDASRAEAEPSPMLKRFLTAGPAKGQLTVAPALQSLIRFEELNLLGDWPFRGNFDIIFCRNVVIYFDADTRNRLWRRFSDRLEPGGWLFVGHSERVDPSLQTWLRPAGITRYQRTDAPRALGADLPDQSTAPSAKTLT
jgi:chemotaxis protein methyltransferase CheR